MYTRCRTWAVSRTGRWAPCAPTKATAETTAIALVAASTAAFILCMTAPVFVPERDVESRFDSRAPRLSSSSNFPTGSHVLVAEFQVVTPGRVTQMRLEHVSKHRVVVVGRQRHGVGVRDGRLLRLIGPPIQKAEPN